MEAAVGLIGLALLAAAGAEASVGGVVPSDAASDASDASDAARAPSAVFGGMGLTRLRSELYTYTHHRHAVTGTLAATGFSHPCNVAQMGPKCAENVAHFSAFRPLQRDVFRAPQPLQRDIFRAPRPQMRDTSKEPALPPSADTTCDGTQPDELDTNTTLPTNSRPSTGIMRAQVPRRAEALIVRARP